MLKPIKLNPVCKEIIWGGNKLKTEYNKVSDLKNIAESWELTVRPDGMNTVCGSEYQSSRQGSSRLGKMVERKGRYLC